MRRGLAVVELVTLPDMDRNIERLDPSQSVKLELAGERQSGINGDAK